MQSSRAPGACGAVAVLLSYAASAQTPIAEPPLTTFLPAIIDPGPGSNALLPITRDLIQAAPSRLTPLERADLTVQLQQQLPDLRERVQLSEAENEQILTLLLDAEVIKRATLGGTTGLFASVLADDQLRRVAQIKSLLGERFALYEAYIVTLPTRRKVLEFNATLDEEPLSDVQKEQLIQVLWTAEQQQPPASRPKGYALSSDDPEEAERAASRLDAERKQAEFLRLRAVQRQQLQQVPQILTATQLEMFERIQTQRLTDARDYVQDLREAAGLSPDIPE